MRISLPTFLIALLAISGCGRTPALLSRSTSQLVTSYGTNHDPVTGWTIRVTESNGIYIGPRTNTALFGVIKFASTVSPSDWKAHPGWFAYAENDERVWIFDGERKLLMVNATAKDVSIRGNPHKNYPVPAEVAARLPESLRQEIGK